ncbi:MAG: RNA polymerase sigma factor [Acidobacteriota bacterium]
MQPSDSRAAAESPAPNSQRGADQAKLERLRKNLLQTVHRLLGSRHRQMAEDIVQEALTRVLEKLGPDGLVEASPGLLYKTAYHVFIDDRRRSGRVQFHGLDMIAAPPLQSPGQERRLSDQRFSGMVVSCLKLLASARRQAVFLKVLGFSAKDSARILGRTARQIRNHIFRGITNLRSCLDEKGVHD